MAEPTIRDLDALVVRISAAMVGNSARLDAYWTHGEGHAKIGWGTPGDFERCVLEMRKVGVPEHEIKGHCSNLHLMATGFRPGHAPSEGGNGR